MVGNNNNNWNYQLFIISRSNSIYGFIETKISVWGKRFRRFNKNHSHNRKEINSSELQIFEEIINYQFYRMLGKQQHRNRNTSSRNGIIIFKKNVEKQVISREVHEGSS